MSVNLQSNFGMGADFGHADYVQAVNAGATPAEIRDWATRNPNQFINENARGAGGLYDRIMSGSTPRSARPGIDNTPINTTAGNWIGNPNSYDPNARGYTISRNTTPTVQGQLPTFSGSPNYVQTNSPTFVQQTYNPSLGYERPGNPGDNPYVSSFTPVQESYMNDPSTLSAEELAYREGNIQGLDDRQYSIENAGQFLNDWMIDLWNDPHRKPVTQIETVSPEGNDDNDKNPYEQYGTQNYY